MRAIDTAIKKRLTQEAFIRCTISLGCGLQEVGKDKMFLIYTCNDENGTKYKCPFSKTYYNIIWSGGCSMVKFNAICPFDTHFYQSCGHSYCNTFRTIGNHTLFCSSFVCKDKHGTFSGTMNELLHMCPDEEHCDSKIARTIGRYINETHNCEPEGQYRCNSKRMAQYITNDKRCDNVCDCLRCDDEADCNNVKYGAYDHNNTNNSYLTPNKLCTNNDTREEFCTPDKFVRNCTDFTGKIRKLYTRQICSILENDPEEYLCEDLLDQVNCTDVSRVALNCSSNGFDISISKQAICKGSFNCDSGYDDNCVEPEGGCLIHKNQLCDDIDDCDGKLYKTRIAL